MVAGRKSASKRKESVDDLVQAAKLKAERYAALGLSGTAGFYADKVATFESSAEHLLLLARQLAANGQHRRALHLLTASNLHEKHAAARLLAAQCLFHLNELDECIVMLGGEDAEAAALGGKVEMGMSDLSIEAEEGETKAALCVLRGRVFEKMENAKRAVVWYKRALMCDIMCVEAFQALWGGGLLTKAEAKQFVAEIEAQEHGLQGWITQYYQACMAGGEMPKGPGRVGESVDIVAVEARRRYENMEFEECVQLCRGVLEKDPFVEGSVMETYLAALVELDERHELFAMAHVLVERQPKEGVTWLAVGYYYLTVGKADLARRFLHKATSLNSRLASGWIAFGHAFAIQDESDQAMAAYRTASRLFPAANLPSLFMGMEYARQSSLGHASALFQSALKSCPADPGPRHELGVVAFRKGDLERAVEYFKSALALWGSAEGNEIVVVRSEKRAQGEEATLFNLGHCYRRLRDFVRAKACYERALGLRPHVPSTCAALGITLHAMGDLEGAVGMYHRALRHNTEDVMCSELLERALRDMFLRGDGQAMEEPVEPEL